MAVQGLHTTTSPHLRASSEEAASSGAPASGEEADAQRAAGAQARSSCTRSSGGAAQQASRHACRRGAAAHEREGARGAASLVAGDRHRGPGAHIQLHIVPSLQVHAASRNNIVCRTGRVRAKGVAVCVGRAGRWHALPSAAARSGSRGRAPRAPVSGPLEHHLLSLLRLGGRVLGVQHLSGCTGNVPDKAGDG